MPNPLLRNPNFVQTRRVETFITSGETGGSDNVDGGKSRRCLPRVFFSFCRFIEVYIA